MSSAARLRSSDREVSCYYHEHTARVTGELARVTCDLTRERASNKVARETECGTRHSVHVLNFTGQFKGFQSRESNLPAQGTFFSRMEILSSEDL